MSNKAQTTVASAGKFSLTRKIASFLKLGDDGKLDSFFSKIVRTLTNEVKALQKNLDNLKFNHEQKLDDLQDKLSDAKDSLAEAFLKVNPELIANNAAQSDFMETYLSNLDDHEATVKSIEKNITDELESYKKDAKDIQDQIDSRELRIKTVSQE